MSIKPHLAIVHHNYMQIIIGNYNYTLNACKMGLHNKATNDIECSGCGRKTIRHMPDCLHWVCVSINYSVLL